MAIEWPSRVDVPHDLVDVAAVHRGVVGELSGAFAHDGDRGTSGARRTFGEGHGRCAAKRARGRCVGRAARTRARRRCAQAVCCGEGAPKRQRPACPTRRPACPRRPRRPSHAPPLASSRPGGRVPAASAADCRVRTTWCGAARRDSRRWRVAPCPSARREPRCRGCRGAHPRTSPGPTGTRASGTCQRPASRQASAVKTREVQVGARRGRRERPSGTPVWRPGAQGLLTTGRLASGWNAHPWPRACPRRSAVEPRRRRTRARPCSRESSTYRRASTTRGSPAARAAAWARCSFRPLRDDQHQQRA